MKRVYFAIALLTVITIGCISCVLLETKNLQEMITFTEDIEQTFRNGDIQTTKAMTGQLQKEFPEKTRSFELFLHHSVLEDIAECIALLPLYLESDEKDDFLAQVNRCRLLLEKQLELEMPTWKNIL